ncbi:tetratricopeptide repeat protein [Paraburkholderia mimosarum]|uniref:tetratricopeptide repeat protein n=1 Tax=Paraburkholderia mimosarum TaxID=312026 RepID=UPI000421D1B7|nr:tetratricopeptide repeat protein [Paraburkholderia mimosarum]
MKKNFIRRVLLAFAPLCLWACAQTPTAPAAAPARAPAQANIVADAVKAMGTLSPDVRATCWTAIASMSTAADHIAETADRIHACLASHDLPVALRVFMLQSLTLNEMALKDYSAAIDAQRAAIDLEPTPGDDQLLMLASLYETTHQYPQGMAALEQLRARHEAAHDLDTVLGAPYYLVLGKTLTGTGRHQEAIEAFSNAIRLTPALVDAYRGRAAEREAGGDTAGARADYVEFARWAPENSIDATTQAKLSGMGIDAASERRHPFGNANPLHEAFTQSLAAARASLQTAATPAAKAAAYSDISTSLDGTGQHEQALAAIDQAIALAPDDISLKQSRVTTLFTLDRVDDALKAAAPLLDQMRSQLAGGTDPVAVYHQYVEVTGSSGWAYMLKGDWTGAVDMFADCARGSEPLDRDYLAALYVIIRARSNGAAPANPYFENYIQRRSVMPATQYRQVLLQYVRGRAPLSVVYGMIALIPNPAALQNALAETWMMAAAYNRFVKHDDVTARTYRTRVGDLEPSGTMEWTMVRFGGV